MISYAEALSKLFAAQVNSAIETVSIKHANKRIVAEDIYSPIAMPPYDNSAMDGYALFSEQTQLASVQQPIWLKASGCIGAGEKMTHSSQAVAIMTGAPLPKGPDAVIPIEDILTSPQRPHHIGVTRAIKSGENIRRRAEDIQAETKLVSIGDRLTPAHIMTLSGVGLEQIRVFQSLKVLVLATGKELVVGAPKDNACQIPDCNSPFLYSSLVNDWAAEVQVEHLLSDTEEEFIDRIQAVYHDKNPPQIIISTGAVSAGRYDFIPEALKKIHARTIFHRVAIRPGKPILFAQLDNGTYYFGLPGNPASVASGLRFFVYPFLRHYFHMPQEIPQYVRLDKKVAVNKALTFFLRARYYTDAVGNAWLNVPDGQASFMISTMLISNAWAMLENGPLVLEKNTLVPVYFF